jgi:hypothetical protein
VTRQFIGLSGFPHRLPLVPPVGSDDDREWYWRQVQGDLQSGRPTVARVVMAGRQVDLQLNPAALAWWYITCEEDRAPAEVDSRVSEASSRYAVGA